MIKQTDNTKLGLRLGNQLIELTLAERRRHTLMIGKTGVGKSTALRNMAVQDIAAGRGFALLDPHGDVADELLDCIPKSRVNDVVYFNPGDMDYPIGFNLLGNVNEDARPMVPTSMERFPIETLPPIAQHFGHRDLMISQSRMRYARPRAKVEARLVRFLGRYSE